jgi:hypothetical protein
VKGRCDLVYSVRKAAWIRDSAVQVPDEADPRVVQMFARGLASSSGSGLSDLHAGLVRWSSTNAPTEAAARNLLLLVSALDPLITSTVDWALNEAPRWVAVFIDMLNAKWGLLDAANVESPSTKQLVAAVAHILNPKDTAAQWLAEFASESFREEISLDLLVQWREKGEGKRLTFNLEGLSAETARRMARAYYRGPITTWVRHHLEGPPEVTAAFRSMKPRT